MSPLAIHWNVDPVIINIGSFGLRWYSLGFLVAFLLGYYIIERMFKQENVKEDYLGSLFLYIFLAILIGARLGHCLFYQPDYFLGSWKGFFEIFMPWKGGLASHGGTIALILAMIWFANKYGKKEGFDFMWIADHIVIPIAFAACFIRLGNLFNSEIYGDVTNLPWGFVFERRGETLPKHPTQLYEAGTYLLLGILLMLLYKYRLDKMYRGQFLGIFMIICFGSRILIEFIKEPQVGFEENMLFNMGQLLSVPFVLFGIGCLIWASRKKIPAAIVRETPKKPEPTHYAKSLSK